VREGARSKHSPATKTKGVITKAWLYRYQIDKRERVMGLGSARVVRRDD